MKLLVRGDCCCRRAVNFNRDLFDGGKEVVRDEKVRSDFMADRAAGLGATAEDLARHLSLDEMARMLRHYALSQVTGATLAEPAADLIVMDNYADMNFQAWRHRAEGWKIWIHPRYLKDREEFEAEFEALGHISFEDSLESHVRLIEHYRSMHGPLPVLYLNQPIAYYPKLEHRAEFRQMGARLAERLDKVFWGEIPDSDLVPADLGSCGEGKTLHFDGPTYRAMILQAFDQGLAECLPHLATSSSPS